MLRFLDIDPQTLVVCPQRAVADAWKLQRQIANFGSSIVDMPPLEVNEDPLGRLRIVDSMTRATRAARLSPGTRITVVVTARLRKPFRNATTIADTLKSLGG
jgi:hypothetical protein